MFVISGPVNGGQSPISFSAVFAGECFVLNWDLTPIRLHHVIHLLTHFQPRLPNRIHLRRRLREYAALARAVGWAGAPGGVEVVELNVGQVQRHGDMAQAAVHADHTGTGGQRVGQRIQAQARPDHSTGQLSGEDFAALLLGSRAMQQGQGVACGLQARTQSHPVVERPLLVGA